VIAAHRGLLPWILVGVTVKVELIAAALARFLRNFATGKHLANAGSRIEDRAPAGVVRFMEAARLTFIAWSAR
jgi:hypothetical protein